MCEPEVVESLELFRRKHDLQSRDAEFVHQIEPSLNKRKTRCLQSPKMKR